jgi:hypothetical protein
MISSPSLCAAWLADQITPVEFSNDPVGLIGVQALFAQEPVHARIQHALAAAGLTNFTKASWQGLLLITSKKVPDGCVMALAPLDGSFEGILALSEKVLTAKTGEIWVGEEGRGKTFPLR